MIKVGSPSPVISTIFDFSACCSLEVKGKHVRLSVLISKIVIIYVGCTATSLKVLMECWRLELTTKEHDFIVSECFTGT